ncbi:MAG: transposase [Opitutales bacterium]|nr:transposase [Opitutales bacterium]
MRFKMKMGVYHCVSRVVDRRRVLGEAEREVMRKILWRVADFCGAEVLTYCLMGNHFHILVRAGKAQAAISADQVYERAEAYYSGGKSLAQMTQWAEISAAYRGKGEAWAAWERRLRSRMGDVSWFMRLFKQNFSVWFNRSGDRSGTLWERRFTSVLVEDAPLAVAAVAAYIDLNPVRAGLVKDPRDYRWCGYAEALARGKGKRPSLCRFFTAKDWKTALARYRLMLFNKGATARMGRATISNEARKAVHVQKGEIGIGDLLRHRLRYFTAGGILGSRAFVEERFQAWRRFFGKNRRRGAHPMRGGNWEGLTTLRNLQKRTVEEPRLAE